MQLEETNKVTVKILEDKFRGAVANGNVGIVCFGRKGNVRTQGVQFRAALQAKENNKKWQ